MNRKLPKPPLTVDLHADSFLTDYDQYDSDELLLESLDRLRETLDAAIYWEYTEIKFIHGRGKGILKQEIYRLLDDYKYSGAISHYYPSYQNEDIVIVMIGV
ncbi:Smr/MutS family protein [Sphingobacterium hungaricum]|uniref:Smr domain-containing protein n=1 Tax=Sphingobacterium hungaricum TaxID=2082723 RepID=A0A928UXM7_9SPHI|nr:Smr/MutS family protein [Sphingobacterium hungaricum]MBE8714577.1 hypothetical protein [Sphingobacterium hungaricum]